VPLAVDAEVVRRDDARSVADVHARAVVRVGADDERTALRVEREVSDVDVARRAENASRLPVQQTVGMQQNADAIEVGHQLVRAVNTVGLHSRPKKCETELISLSVSLALNTRRSMTALTGADSFTSFLSVYKAMYP